jgi:hypothetical protein
MVDDRELQALAEGPAGGTTGDGTDVRDADRFDERPAGTGWGVGSCANEGARCTRALCLPDRPKSIQEIAPREIRFDPLMALGQWVDRLNPGDVDHERLALSFANGIQAIAVFGPFEADTIDVFARDSCPERAGHFLADHA